MKSWQTYTRFKLLSLLETFIKSKWFRLKLKNNFEIQPMVRFCTFYKQINVKYSIFLFTWNDSRLAHKNWTNWKMICTNAQAYFTALFEHWHLITSYSAVRWCFREKFFASLAFNSFIGPVNAVVTVKTGIQTWNPTAGDPKSTRWVFSEGDPGSESVQWFLDIIKAVCVATVISFLTRVVVFLEAVTNDMKWYCGINYNLSANILTLVWTSWQIKVEQ